jgi:hypothetical protein
MSWSISDTFPPWGDSGERPPDNFQYDGGDQVNEKHLDYLWNQAGTLENNVRSALNDIDADSDGVVDAADTLQTGGSAAVIRDTTNNSDLLVANEGGPFDLSGTAQDLRLATGQAIEDGSGTKRIDVTSGATIIRDETGTTAFDALSDTRVRVVTESNRPFQIADNEQAVQDAVQYDTDPSAGVLRTPNAGFRVETDGNATSGVGTEVLYRPDEPRGEIQAFDRDASSFIDMKVRASTIDLDARGGLVDMSKTGADLRLSTSQSIEDGSGTDRISLSSGETGLYDENGTLKIQINGGGGTNIQAYSGDSWQIFDQEGNFSAFNYTTSSSPSGTLELKNATLDANGHIINDALALVLEDQANKGVSWQVRQNPSSGVFAITDAGDSDRLQLNTSGDLQIEGELTENASI